MPGNGLSFHPELYAAQGKLPLHLVLTVRRHHYCGWHLRGDYAGRIGEHHATAKEAVKAVREFIEGHAYTGNVTVYTPDNREVFRVIEIARR